MLKRVLAILLGGMLWPAFARGDCVHRPGDHIALFSNNYDPDVLVWDSRPRLRGYIAQSYATAKLLLPHALLARAGTLGIVTACHPNDVHPKYRAAPTDAVRIKLTSGAYRGRYGWVVVDDIHLTGVHATRRLRP